MSLATKELDTVIERIPTLERDCNALAEEVLPPAVRKGVDRRWISTFALAIVVVGGVLPRLNHAGKSLWTGEAWVANSVLSDSLAQMFHYDAWLQTTPPLFLLLVRQSVHVFGISLLAFRAVPFLLSLLSLVLLAWLSRLVLRTPFAVLCTALLALCPPAVVFSKEVKQYSGDLAATCLILLLSWMYLATPNVRRYLWLISGLAAVLFLSYPAVCFIPLVFWVLFTAQPATKDGQTLTPRVRFLRLVPAAGLVALISALNYWFFVRPNTAPQLTAFWAEGYPTLGSVKILVRFYAEYFLGMSVSYYVPSQSREAALEFLSAAGHLPLFVIAISCIGALWVAWPILLSRPPYRNALIFCSVPILTLAAINLLRLYPVSGRRLTLFMFPCIAVITATILQALWDRLVIPAKADPSGALAGFLAAACILVVFIAGAHADGWANYSPEDEDTFGLFHYLKSEARPDDIVYIHTSLAEPAKVYFKILAWSPPNLYFGKTGWPCCTRQIEIHPGNAVLENTYVDRDIQNGLLNTGHKHLWLVFTSREQHWRHIGRDERQIITGYLRQRGCQQELEQHFTNVEAMKFACALGAN